jgi:thioredoxin reductase (NADPH)
MYDVIVVGSGPAGLTAALYTSRANLKTLIVGGSTWGGQLMLTTEVENFPGFPEGIQGPELMERMRKQAERFGAEFIQDDVAKADFSARPFKVWVGDDEYESRSVILSTGARTRWLGLESEQSLIGKGVSSCATCDGFFFTDKEIVVVGGGDSALEEALFLTKFASKVTVIHRRDALRASKIMRDRAEENEKIEFIWNTEVIEVLGESKVEGVRLLTHPEGNPTQRVSDPFNPDDPEAKVWEFPCEGVFVAIGHIPDTAVFKGQIELDKKGYIVVHHGRRTNIDGVFVAGDVHDYNYRQAITAAAYGCMAGMDAERWLEANA